MYMHYSLLSLHELFEIIRDNNMFTDNLVHNNIPIVRPTTHHINEASFVVFIDRGFIGVARL